MKKNPSDVKPLASLDPFIEWAHKTGRLFIFVFIGYTMILPFILCLFFGIFPKWNMILPGFISMFALMAPTGLFEAGIYVPMLGSSSYLTFATGNLINLKIPCVLNAQKVAEVEQNTTEGDAVSLIATCVSSIVTVVILTIGVLLAIPLKGILQSETVSKASNYLLPSLFGAICLSFLMPDSGKRIVKRKLLPAAIPAVLAALVTILGILDDSMAMAMLIIAIPLCILFARIFYKKGIVKVVPNPRYQEDKPETTE